MVFFLFFRIFRPIRSSHLHSKICHPHFGFYLTKCLSGPSLPTMRFTQVAIIATLATAAFAAPVPNEDLDISLRGVNIGKKRDQAAGDLGISLGASVGLLKREEDLDVGLGAGATIGKRAQDAEDLDIGLGAVVGVKRDSTTPALVKALGVTASDLEAVL